MRSYWDYFLYIAMLKKKETFIILVDLGIFVAAVFAFIGEVNRAIKYTDLSLGIFALLVLTLVKFVWDCYKMFSDYSAYNHAGKYTLCKLNQIVDEKGLFSLQMKPSIAEERRGFVLHETPCFEVEKYPEYVLFSDMVDNHIRTTELLLKPNTKKYKQIRRVIRERSDALLPFLTNNFYLSKSTNKYFFNEQKLCLSEDIKLNSDQVGCHRGSYFDTYLTNIISLQKLIRADADDMDHEVFDGRKLYPYEVSSNELRLFDITSSKINNQIGISTLAFTEDHYLILWNQNTRAQSSSNLIVPSGSGSCDWKDIVEGSFTNSIQNGMTRELKEESSLKKFTTEQIGDTRIVGFFRWIRKAGKPEFVGITKMNATLQEIHPETREVTRLKDSNPLVETLEQLKESLAEIKGRPNVSVPLYMNIHALERYIAREPEEVVAFLGLES